MTANLQPTVKQMAAQAGVSERMIYDALKLQRSGRDDLKSRVQSGELSINRALLLAGLRQKPSAAQKLEAAWLRASAAERIKFTRWLTERGNA